MIEKNGYGVKVLYKYEYGEPKQELIDENFSSSQTGFEESIIYVSAESFEESIVISKKIARSREHDFTNIYMVKK